MQKSRSNRDKMKCSGMNVQKSRKRKTANTATQAIHKKPGPV